MYRALSMKSMTVSFLNVAYVTLFDKGDNLALSREIEILDLLSLVALTTTCTDNGIYSYIFSPI